MKVWIRIFVANATEVVPTGRQIVTAHLPCLTHIRRKSCQNEKKFPSKGKLEKIIDRGYFYGAVRQYKASLYSFVWSGLL